MIGLMQVTVVVMCAVLAVQYVKCDFSLVILHTNDMHSHYKEVSEDLLRCQEQSAKCYGGFARVLSSLIRFRREAKGRGVPTLYLDSGDVFGDTVYYTEFKWELAADMMNLLEPQAMGLGSHEFDDGIEGLAPYIKKVKAPVVCSNIDTTKIPDLQSVSRSTVITLEEGENKAKIGIVGYVTKFISKKNLKKPDSPEAEAKIEDEIKSLKAETERLRKEEKVDIIIALGQSGYDMDQIIAKHVGEIDVIVGGHSHTFLSDYEMSNNKKAGPYPTIVSPIEDPKKRIPIVQAYYGTKYMGHLELKFDDKMKLKDFKGQPVLLNGSPDAKALKDIEKVLKSKDEIIAAKYGKKIGTTEVALKGGSSYCKFGECTIGNLIADAFVDFVSANYKASNGKPVLIALVPSGSIKASLFGKSVPGYTGDIILEDLVNVLPYRNSLEVVVMKGSHLKALLENSVRKCDVKKRNSNLFEASLLQVSGLVMKFDLGRPVGKRVVSVKVAEGKVYRELKKDVLYNVVMTDFFTHSYVDANVEAGSESEKNQASTSVYYVTKWALAHYAG
ncbi:protein 5NUC-like [Macrosteles quadrilineatus]|uniref:protein 5NUC-like n=1 Tax=Macrosteles quadrilineatus TaxID=74068 RepID=UPI0023E185FB|nr:protein 5NUC-like [Macrosteles quadrilineatus]